MSETLDRRIHAIRPDLADARLEGRVVADRFVEGKAAYVAVPLADLRRHPAPNAPLETQALHGENVQIFEETGEGWCWVQLEGDGYVGWMPEIALLSGPAPEPTHVVTAPRTLVFPGPDIKQTPMHDLPMGALVSATGEAHDHNATYAVIQPFGAVVIQHLAKLPSVSRDFVAVAERFLGVPYLWGGKSMLGIDCSGLVQLALSRAGIAVPRDTDMQFSVGKALEPGDVHRRGDLVFWKGHVGIMLDEARLLHANAHHMMTAVEPLAEAVARLEAKGAPVIGVRRLS